MIIATCGPIFGTYRTILIYTESLADLNGRGAIGAQALINRRNGPSNSGEDRENSGKKRVHSSHSVDFVVESALHITRKRVMIKSEMPISTNPEIPSTQACRPKPSLPERDLIALHEADRLGSIFKMLAHPTRLRLIHALIREGDVHVSDLAEEVGMAVQAVSNQLQRLADAGLVDRRSEGPYVFYRVIDPCVPVLIERGWCHVEEYPTSLQEVRGV